MKPERRVPTMGHWSISMGPEFTTIDNGDSWQAHHEDRVVYVSSLALQDAHDQPTPADSLCATVARTLAGSAGERHSHSAGALRGEAEVKRVTDRWQLKGFMCATRTVATFVVDFVDEEDEEWALRTWRSLEHP